MPKLPSGHYWGCSHFLKRILRWWLKWSGSRGCSPSTILYITAIKFWRRNKCVSEQWQTQAAVKIQVDVLLLTRGEFGSEVHTSYTTHTYVHSHLYRHLYTHRLHPHEAHTHLALKCMLQRTQFIQHYSQWPAKKRHTNFIIFTSMDDSMLTSSNHSSQPPPHSQTIPDHLYTPRPFLTTSTFSDHSRPPPRSQTIPDHF